MLDLLMQKDESESDNLALLEVVGNKFSDMNLNSENAKSGSSTSFKDARSTLLLIMDVIFFSKNHLSSSESRRLENIEKLAVDQLKSSLQVRNSFSDNILYCLLYLDGLIMFNIDIVRLIDRLSPLLGVNFYEVLFEILSNKYVEDSIKEVASHILSAELSFVYPEGISLSLWKELINWTYNYYTNK